MSENLKRKLRSKVVWVTAIPLIANLIALWVSPEYADKFSTTASTVVSLLAVYGILNNPNDCERF